MIEFFLGSGCSQLQVANIHMNVSHFLHDEYLHKLLTQNPLKKLTRLGLYLYPRVFHVSSFYLSRPHFSGLSSNQFRLGQMGPGDLAFSQEPLNLQVEQGHSQAKKTH